MSEFRLSVRGDMKAILRDLRHVDQVLVKRGAASALNKTVQQARTQVVREVSADLKVKQAPIRKRVAFGKGDRATPRRLTAALRGRLQKLSVTTVMTPAQRAKLQQHVGRGNRRTGTYAAGRLWPSAFIAPNRSRRKVEVFRRKGATRLPLEIVGFNVAGPINNSATKHINRLGPTAFRKHFDREMRFRLMSRR